MLSSASTLFPILVTALSVVLCAIGMAFHELWRDEAFTCLLLETVPSAARLPAELHFTGHPPAWYMLTYALARVTGVQGSIQLLNLAAVGAAVYTVARWGPFSPLQKILLALGFYPLYQYGVIARPYGLMLLLLFCFCALRGSREDRPLALGLCVAGLGLLHALGLLLAGVVLLFEVGRRLRGGAEAASGRVVAGFALAAAALLGTALQLWLAREGGGIPPSPAPLKALLVSFSNGFLPDFGVLAPRPFRAVGLLLAAGSFVFLAIRAPRIGLGYYLAWTGVLTVLFAAITTYRWHHGFLFVVFVAALWIQVGADGDRMDPRWLQGSVLSLRRRRVALRLAGSYPTVLFAVHAGVGLYALGYDVLAPVSSGETAARYLRAHGLEAVPRIGVLVERSEPGTEGPGTFRFDVDYAQATFMHLPESSIFEPRSGERVRYWRHYDEPDYFASLPLTRLEPELDRLCERLGSEFVVIVNRPDGRATAQLAGRTRKLRDFPSVPPPGENVSLFLHPCREGVLRSNVAGD